MSIVLFHIAHVYDEVQIQVTRPIVYETNVAQVIPPLTTDPADRPIYSQIYYSDCLLL